jgi:tripartite-type tricarboxylate transporter receptor subunit TctC
MAGYLYSLAPRDGSVLAIAAQTLPIEQAFGTKGVQYDVSKFGWIGRVAPVVEVSYTWHTSPTHTLDDARRRVTVMGGASPATNTVIYLNVLNALAGTKFKIVSGYPGTGELNIALERGEIEGTTKTWEAFRSENMAWFNDHKVSMIVQYALHKSRDLPDVPLMMDLGRTEKDRAALRFFTSGNELGRSVVTAPDVPAERLKALRAAFLAMTKDPEFLAETRERRIDVTPMSGADLQAFVKGILAAPSDVVERARKARLGDRS